MEENLKQKLQGVTNPWHTIPFYQQLVQSKIRELNNHVEKNREISKSNSSWRLERAVKKSTAGFPSMMATRSWSPTCANFPVRPLDCKPVFHQQRHLLPKSSGITSSFRFLVPILRLNIDGRAVQILGFSKEQPSQTKHA